MLIIITKKALTDQTEYRGCIKGMILASAINALIPGFASAQPLVFWRETWHSCQVSVIKLIIWLQLVFSLGYTCLVELSLSFVIWAAPKWGMPRRWSTFCDGHTWPHYKMIFCQIWFGGKLDEYLAIPMTLITLLVKQAFLWEKGDLNLSFAEGLSFIIVFESRYSLLL